MPFPPSSNSAAEPMKPVAGVIGVIGVLAALLMVTFWLETGAGVPSWRPQNVTDVTYAAAKDALGFMKDWAVWMAALQSTTLVAVAALAKDGKLGPQQRSAAMITATLNGAGLLSTAMTLSSIPSLLVRMAGICDTYPLPAGRCDFYELPFMGFGHMPRFAYFSTWQHWLWVGGLTSFGWLIAVSLRESNLNRLPAPPRKY